MYQNPIFTGTYEGENIIEKWNCWEEAQAYLNLKKGYLGNS